MLNAQTLQSVFETLDALNAQHRYEYGIPQRWIPGMDTDLLPRLGGLTIEGHELPTCYAYVLTWNSTHAIVQTERYGDLLLVSRRQIAAMRREEDEEAEEA